MEAGLVSTFIWSRTESFLGGRESYSDREITRKIFLGFGKMNILGMCHACWDFDDLKQRIFLPTLFKMEVEDFLKNGQIVSEHCPS